MTGTVTLRIQRGLTYFTQDQGQYGYDFELWSTACSTFTILQRRSVRMATRQDSSTLGAPSFWDSDDFNYWDIESQNGFTYLAYQRGVWRFSDTNGSVAASGTGISHPTTSSDIAISMDGDMVVGTSPTAAGPSERLPERHHVPSNAPGLCSARHRGEQPARTDLPPDGRLHVLMVNNSSGVIGFYHFYADLGSDLSGDVSLSWNTQGPTERNQSTGWSSRASHSATEDHSSEPLLERREDVRGHVQHHRPVALDPRRVSWTTELVAESTGKNEGVEIATNSTGVVHVAWINHHQEQLMLSHKSSGSWSHEV